MCRLCDAPLQSPLGYCRNIAIALICHIECEAIRPTIESRFADTSAYFPGSSTNRCVFAASTAFALNGSVNVVPSYHAFHWSM